MLFHFDESPAIALLHKKHAAIVLSFYSRAFKANGASEISEERLESRWEKFIEEEVTGADWEGEPPANSAKHYFEEWCKNRWLARSYSDKEESYLYRLTSHSEQALLFIEQHLSGNRRSFVGTESNFSKIWHALVELSEKTQTDPAVREKQLLAERDRIDAELMELRETGKPKTLDVTAVKSRLFDLVNMANRFLADFRAVEDSFRKQRDQVQNLYLEQEQSPGDIIACAIDAVELLKDSDEGRSFFGFQRMLRSSEDLELLRLLTEDCVKLATQYDIEPSVLNGLVGRLLEERNRTHSTLSTITKQLHVVVEESFRRDRRLLLDLVSEIKKRAHFLRSSPPEHIETVCHLSPSVNPLLGMKFFEKTQVPVLNTTLRKTDEKAAMDRFFKGIGPQLRLQEILSIINLALNKQPQVMLSRLVEDHPLKAGAIDLLCYVFAAGRSREHQILDIKVEVSISEQPRRIVRLPEIIYRRASKHE